MQSLWLQGVFPLPFYSDTYTSIRLAYAQRLFWGGIISSFQRPALKQWLIVNGDRIKSAPLVVVFLPHSSHHLCTPSHHERNQRSLGVAFICVAFSCISILFLSFFSVVVLFSSPQSCCMAHLLLCLRCPGFNGLLCFCQKSLSSSSRHLD